MPALAAHPERATLLEFAAQQLDEAAASSVERHLRRCTACRALVASSPAPAPAPVVDAVTATIPVATPSPADAVAAAELTSAPSTSLGNSLLDDLVVTQPLSADAPTAVQPITAAQRRAAIRTRRIIAAALAIVIIALLAVTAWFVTTDEWRTSSENSRSQDARTVQFDTQSI